MDTSSLALTPPKATLMSLMRSTRSLSVAAWVVRPMAEGEVTTGRSTGGSPRSSRRYRALRRL